MMEARCTPTISVKWDPKVFFCVSKFELGFEMSLDLDSLPEGRKENGQGKTGLSKWEVKDSEASALLRQWLFFWADEKLLLRGDTRWRQPGPAHGGMGPHTPSRNASVGMHPGPHQAPPWPKNRRIRSARELACGLNNNTFWFLTWALTTQWPWTDHLSTLLHFLCLWSNSNNCIYCKGLWWRSSLPMFVKNFAPWEMPSCTTESVGVHWMRNVKHMIRPLYDGWKLSNFNRWTV